MNVLKKLYRFYPGLTVEDAGIPAVKNTRKLLSKTGKK